MCWVKKSRDTETKWSHRRDRDSSYRRNISIWKRVNDGYQAEHSDSTTACRCSKHIRCRSLMSSCRYRSSLREDADQLNYRPATHRANATATWISCSCHATQSQVMLLVVCMRVCLCVWLLSRWHLMYTFVWHNCICTQLSIYCDYLFWHHVV